MKRVRSAVFNFAGTCAAMVPLIEHEAVGEICQCRWNVFVVAACEADSYTRKGCMRFR